MGIHFKFLSLNLNEITAKQRKQGQESLFLTKDATAIPTKDNTVSISSNDKSEDAAPADSNDFDFSVISTKTNNSGKTKLNPTSSNHNYVNFELFNTFYDGFMEYKHFTNDVIHNFSFNKKIGKSFENETESQQSIIKLLQQEIQTLKNKNKNFKNTTNLNL